jgi:hypothetical protein
MDTQSSFRELLELIKIEQPEYIESLGAGYSIVEIETAIKVRPIPEALITIYATVGRDIDKDLVRGNLIPGYSLNPLESIDSAMDIYREIRNEYIARMGDDVSASCYLVPEAIPFLNDGCGYSIGVVNSPDDRSIWAMPKVGLPAKINTNFDRFILTAIECYWQAAYYQDLDDDRNIWDTDWVLATEIVGRIDPEITNYPPH